MEKQIKILENGSVQINEIILTDKALATLKFFQEDDNSSLRDRIQEILEAICFLALDSDIYIDKIPICDAMNGLAYLHDNLKDLLKPTELKA